jgi:hypothetical protein
MKVEKDFKEFIELLNKNDVRYLVVGGYAVAYHSIPRFTKDIDFFIEPTKDNSKNVLATCAQFGFGNIGLKEEFFQELGQIIQLGYSPLRIDIITTIAGVTFEDAWKNRVKGFYGDVPCNFISKEDLIINKKSTARKQDLADLETLTKKVTKKRAHGK